MKTPIVLSGTFSGKAQGCAIGTFIGLHGKNVFKVTRIWYLGSAWLGVGV
jgi:hypothetical protein